MQGTGRSFVGRGRELVELEHGLELTIGGRGQLFLVSGEAGIGKTRLCDELALRASGRGLSVRWGRCWEVGGAPAYWPWMQLLRALLREQAGLTLAAHTRDTLARLLPELGASTQSSHGDGVQPNPAEQRFQLFDAVTCTLREAASSVPLVVILDDLHAADPSSLALLLFVARELRELRVCLVCTVRSREPSVSADAREALARIGREANTIEIARFTADEVRALLHSRSGGVDDALLASVVRATEGLPLFVAEVARARSSTEHASWVVPETIRAALQARVASLPQPVREVLEATAVLGRETTRTTLAALLDRNVAELQPHLSAALAAGIAVEPEPGLVSFSHALLREAIYREISGDRRCQLHARAAELLDRSHAAETGWGEIANHLLAALPLVGPERALEGSLRAAERALRTYAFEDGAAILEQALSVLAAEAIAPRLHCEVLLVLGEAQIRAHRDGRTTCLRAAELARQLAEPELIARAGLALGAEIWAGRVDPILVSLLEESRRRLPEAPTALRARVLARLAGALQPAVEPHQPVELAREAIAMARGLDDEATLRIVLHGAGSALVDFAPIDERLNVDHQTLVLAEAARDWPLVFRARLRLFFDHLQRGSWTAAETALEGCEAIAVRLRQPSLRWNVVLMRALFYDIHGDFEAAEQKRSEARALMERDEDETRRAPFAMHAFAVALLRHRHERLSELLPLSLAAAMPPAVGQSVTTLLLAVCRSREGRHAEAEQLFTGLELDAANLKNDLFSLHLGSDVCVLSRLPKYAAVFEAHLRPVDDQMVSWGVFGFGAFGPVAGLRAALLGVTERYDEAFTAFGVAADRCRQLGARPALARTLHDHARARLQRGTEADRSVARGMLEEAANIARALEMSALEGWVNGLQSQLSDAAEGGRTAKAAENTPAKPTGALAAFRATGCSLVREGDVWLITHGTRSFRLKHTRGLAMLAQLVDNPGREVHALSLGTDTDPGDLGDAGPAVDARAVRAYRERIEALRDRERTAEMLADADAADRARSEIDELAHHLSAALGLGGKDRKVSSAAERARVNVQRRIKDAITRIAREDAELGRYLSLCIRTGTFSIFQPIE
jgi:hypothetical protein